MSAIPRWKTALQKAIEGDPPAVVMQVATVGKGGQPHVRSQIHRSFVSASDTLPLLVTTSDLRTPKVQQIKENSLVEVVFWATESQEQFRLQGRASVFPGSDMTTGLALAKLKEQNKDWEEERKSTFNNLSGHMRASFVRPVPGSKLSSYDEAKKWPERVSKLGETDDHHVKEAFANFSLVVIEPEYVDYVELGVQPNQRTEFVRDKEGKEWTEQILVP